MDNETKPDVSIIIPVYNVEKYLSKCVESVLNQTLSNIEVILVDDGSTDGSGEMCDSFRTDDRVRVIHKANGGLSDARNAGTGIATAEYIGYVDSDDYIAPDMYEILYENIRREEADISVCGFYDVYADSVRTAYQLTQGMFTTDAKGAIELVLRGLNASVSAVNKLYKKELLLKHPFLVGKTSEDAHFIVPYLTEIRKAVFDMSPKYFYVHRAGTITTRPFRSTDMSIIEAYSNNLAIVDANYPDIRTVALFRYFWAHFYVLDKMIVTKSYGENGEYKHIARKIRRGYFRIMFNRYIGKSRKIAVSGFMIHRSLYALCLKSYHKKKKQLVVD